MKRKCLAIVIILLFFGTSTIPVIAQNIKKNSLVIVNNNWLDFSCNELKKFFNENNEFTKFKKRFFPISIRNNDDLKGFRGKLRGVVSGNGTEDNPYVISGWELQSRKLFILLFHNKDGIHFENINKHVIIKNNYIHDFNNEYADAIELINCRNITVEQNIVARSDSGITSYGLDNFISNCSIQYNTIYENKYGITTAYSKDVVVNNTIFDNTQRGITCNNANALVANNEIASNYDGIWLIGEENSIITQNKIYGNKRNGILAGFEVQYTPPTSIISHNEISSNGKWGISCWIPMRTIICNNSINSNGWDGIYISESSPTIIDNTISANGGCGIYNSGYLPFRIEHNNITRQRKGIYSYLSDSLSITNNSITQNVEIGIECQSSHPQIHDNNFQGNGYAVVGDGWMGPVNATWNWWGAANGPGGSGPGDGDPINNHVDYTPWLTAPNPNA